MHVVVVVVTTRYLPLPRSKSLAAGTLGFGSEADEHHLTAAGTKTREREMPAKLAWVLVLLDKRMEFNCKHWKAFEKKCIRHYAQRASTSSNMVVDETLTASNGANARGDKGKGKAAATNEVRAPKALRPVCTLQATFSEHRTGRTMCVGLHNDRLCKQSTD